MRKFGVFLIIVVLFFSVGCSKTTDKQPKPEIGKKEQIVQEVKVTIQRMHVDGDHLTRVQVTRKKEETAAKTALLALLELPSDKNYFNPIANSTIKLLSFVVQENGIAVVNFNEELKKIKGGSLFEQLFIGSIVNTLTENQEIKAVKILVEGKPIETLTGHLDLTEPLKRNENLLHK